MGGAKKGSTSPSPNSGERNRLQQKPRLGFDRRVGCGFIRRRASRIDIIRAHGVAKHRHSFLPITSISPPRRAGLVLPSFLQSITADSDSGYCLPAQVHPMPQCRRCLFLRRNLHVYRPRPADAHLPDNSGGRGRFLGSKLPPRTTATTAQRVRPLRAPAPAFRAAFQLQHITEIRTRPSSLYWHRHTNGEMLRTPSLGADGPFTHLAGSTSDLGLASTISGTLSQRRHRDCACDDAPEMHHSPSQSDSSYSSVESTSSHGSGSGTGTRYSYSTSGSNNSYQCVLRLVQLDLRVRRLGRAQEKVVARRLNVAELEMMRPLAMMAAWRHEGLDQILLATALQRVGALIPPRGSLVGVLSIAACDSLGRGGHDGAVGGAGVWSLILDVELPTSFAQLLTLRGGVAR
ncbi:hypothetical protein DFH09DRAFT_1281508, partial [Mycena vulgaris]